MEGKKYIYKEMIQKGNKKQIISKEDAFDYVCEKLGITIKPVGVGGSYTLDQLDFMQEIEDWYFSGDWIKYYEDEKEYMED